MCARGSDEDDYTALCNMAAAMARGCAVRDIEVDWLANNELYQRCTNTLCKIKTHHYIVCSCPTTTF